MSWIIHESRLLDCRTPLATTILFRIEVVGCEAFGVRLCRHFIGVRLHCE